MSSVCVEPCSMHPSHENSESDRCPSSPPDSDLDHTQPVADLAAKASDLGPHSRGSCSQMAPLDLAHLSQSHSGREFDAPPLSATEILDSPVTNVAGDLESGKVSFDDLSKPFPAPLAPERLHRRLASAYFAYFLCGWGDGVTGRILPYFEAEYHLTYLTSSLLFVVSTIGFFACTFIVERVVKFLGTFYLNSTQPSFLPACPLVSRFSVRSRRHGGTPSDIGGTGYSPSQARLATLLLGSLIHSTYFIILGSKSGFPSVLVAYVIAAFARSLLTSVINSYVTSTPNKSLGYLMGFWSLGTFAAPFVCQALLAARFPWPLFYFASLAVSAINILLLVFSFRPTQAEFEAERREALSTIRKRSVASSMAQVTVESAQDGKCSLDRPQSGDASVLSQGTAFPDNTLHRVLSMPYQWAFSLFAFLYYGSEMTIVGFIVTYLLAMRNADPDTVGYIPSGFGAGMCIGRWIWGYFSPRLGFTPQKHIVHAFLYVFVTLVMTILIYFVDAILANAICASVIGLALGPIFPATLFLANELMPKEVHMVSMAFISSFAGFGAAMLPFMTGALSNLKGIGLFPYIIIAEAASAFLLWFLFPSKKKGDQ